MEIIKPPTDNLYKFVTIGSLGLVVFVLYYVQQEYGKMLERMSYFATTEYEFLREWAAQPEAPLPDMMLPVDGHEAWLSEEKKQWMPEPVEDWPPESGEFADLIAGSLVLTNYQRLPNADKLAVYFEQPDVLTFYKTGKRMSDADYETFSKNMALDQFKELMRPNTEYYQRQFDRLLALMHENGEAAASLVISKQQIWSLKWALICSIVLTVVGSFSWYWLFQRHQDVIVRCERETALLDLAVKKATSNPPRATP